MCRGFIRLCLVPCVFISTIIGSTQASAQRTSPIYPIITASQTSCVAPCSIAFDGSLTTAPAITSLPFTRLLYFWDFGDPMLGSWGTTGRSKQTSEEPITGHLFEAPGNYTVTMTVRSARRAVATAQITVEVMDPSVAFGGGQTVCVSKSGSFLGCPDQASQIVSQTLSQSLIQTNRRVLLERGQSWNVSTALTLNVTNFQLGAYGTCLTPDSQGLCSNNPQINSTTSDILYLSGPIPAASKIVVKDLTFNGSTAISAVTAQGSFRDVLFLRLKMNSFNNMFMFSPGILTWWNTNGFPGHQLFRGISLVDSRFEHAAGNSGYIFYGAGEGLFIAGNYIHDSVQGQHLIRLTEARGSAILDNDIQNAAAGKHMIKIHAPNYSSDIAFGAHRYSQYNVISGNIIKGQYDDWGTTVGPQNSTSDERVRHLILSQNYFTSTGSEQAAVVLWAQDVSLRNNIFASTRTGVIVARRGIEPAPTRISILNNTFYRPDIGSFTAVRINAGVGNVIFRNNLGSAPLSPDPILISSENSSITQDHNLLVDNARFVSPLNGDFHLQPISPAVDGGVRVPNLTDHDGSWRAGVGSAYDIGALESY